MDKNQRLEILEDNRIRLYDKSNIDSIILPETEDAKYAFDYLSPMIKNGIDKYIKNVHADFKILVIDDIVMPLAITNSKYKNSYVASFYSHYIGYTLEEVQKIKNIPLKFCLQILLSIAGAFFNLLKFDKVLYVNNWFLSTNLYPNLTKEQIELITDFLRVNYPQYSIVFRSINNHYLKDLYSNLLNLDYQMIISRQIYVMDKENMQSKYDLKNDIKLLKTTEYKITESINDDELERVVDLYKQLYLDKYTYANPQFTRAFFKLARDKKLLNLKVFKKQNSLDAVSGYFERNNVITGPLLGYQLDLPRELGLYRMLSTRLILDARESGHEANMSAGVGKFKILRGGIPEMEYSAIYCKDLPLYRRLAYILLQKLTNDIAMPMLCKYEQCGFVKTKLQLK